MSEGMWAVTLLHARGFIVRLKAPSFPTLFTERYSKRVRTIPLGFGWRITIRDLRRRALP